MIFPLEAADYAATIILTLMFIGLGAFIVLLALRVLKGEQAL